MSELSDKKLEEFTRKRIKRLVDEKGVALSAIALKAHVEQGTVKALYEQEGHSKKRVLDHNIGKLDRAMDEIERSLGMVRKCTGCGKELPYGRFHFAKAKRLGITEKCRACAKSQAKNRKSGAKEKKSMNNNTERAMTAEIVKKVKEEDKKEVESKFMAPYFGITPKQLDEVRRGVWDKLLLTPKTPQKAESVLAAVEMLRAEVAGLRREVQSVLIEMGVEMKEVDS